MRKIATVLVGLSLCGLTGCMTNHGQQSTGVIVNVQKEGMFSQTWTIYLLHGTNLVSEKEAEPFGVDPNDDTQLAQQAQHYAETGQRVRLTYTSHSVQSCLRHAPAYTGCYTVEKVEPLSKSEGSK